MSDINNLFRLVLIDLKGKRRLSIKLTDPEGDEVEVRDVTESVTEYIMDKMKSTEPNQIQTEIMPLMSQALVASLVKSQGVELASYVLADEYVRHNFLNMMMVGFALLKFIQKKKLTISTFSEPITDDEIGTYLRTDRASGAITKGAALGYSPLSLLSEMLKEGLIREEDLASMGVSPETAKKLLDEVGVKKEQVN
jgi:hypothetical protein